MLEVGLPKEGNDFGTTDALLQSLVELDFGTDRITIAEQCLAQQDMGREHFLVGLDRVLELYDGAGHIVLFELAERIFVELGSFVGRGRSWTEHDKPQEKRTGKLVTGSAKAGNSLIIHGEDSPK